MVMQRFRSARTVRVALLLLAGALSAATGALAEEPQEADPKPDAIIRSGLPVPRFVSLRSGEVNVRTGPGKSYPIEWKFTRPGMPVEITAEFDTWRRIRDVDGAQGWVHQSMLSGRRTLVVTGTMRVLRQDNSAGSPAVAQAEPGVMGKLLKCRNDWCLVELQGYQGWLRRDEFWGVQKDEQVDN